MQNIVGVQYKSSTKTYYFLAPPFFVSVGDIVVVDTSNGPAVGKIVMGVKEIDESKLDDPLKPVIRLATEKDLARVESLEKKAKQQIPVIEEKVASLKLDMNIVTAEYSFDESKITIIFTSEGRVDFRELLKILAYTLKCKIELRQIGTRDEVKALGGLGLCGRECCCTKFLKEPAHVTVKMAKLQNLSLSPTKTGGLCGRMMCCLSYEDGVYKELARNMPEVGKTIQTPEGEGVVTYNDLLKQKVTVKIMQKDSAYKLKEFAMDELFGNKEEKQEPKQEVKEVLSAENKEDNKSEDVEGKEKKSRHNKRRFFNKKHKGDKK